MCQSDREREFQEVGNARSSNSLIWAGFALTNFVTVVAVFSAFGAEISLPFQLACSLFLMAGGFFATGWALYETAGSCHSLRLAVEACAYRVWKQRNTKKDKFVPNPREIYIKQAEYCSLGGTSVWSTGVAILLWDLRMHLTMTIWILTVVIAYLFAIPRYYNWRETQKQVVNQRE